MHRARRGLARLVFASSVMLAATACGAILGLDAPAFVSEDGSTPAPEDTGTDGARNDASIDASVDADEVQLPPSRLREITFENGGVVGGVNGASYAFNATIQQPGLRGGFAARVGEGTPSYIRYDAPAPQKELFVTFRWNSKTVNGVDLVRQPQVMRIFDSGGQPVLELTADT